MITGTLYRIGARDPLGPPFGMKTTERQAIHMSKKKIKRPQQYKKPRTRTLKEWWQDQTAESKKKMLYICIAAAAVIALVLIWYYGFYNDGSLKVRSGAAVGAQDNWLIAERSHGKNSKYYHIADVADVEGYEYEAEKSKTSSPSTTFMYENEEYHLFISPVNSGVDDMINSVYPLFGQMVGENGTVGDVKELSCALGTARYFAYQNSNTAEDGTVSHNQSLVMYAPSDYKDTCILVSVSLAPETEEGYVTEEALVAEANKGLNAITVIKK